MQKKALTFELPEAALALSTLVAFADDDPSESEGVVMRKYYRLATAEAVQQKFDQGGYLYPGDLKETEVYFLPVLKEADKAFRLRTIAVALESARADGVVDQDEMKLLNYYAGELEVSLAEAEEFGRTALKELDENQDYLDAVEAAGIRELPVLDPDEAGVALCVLCAFADDDPSEAEVGVVREYYRYEAAESLQKKMAAAGIAYPEEIGLLKPAILKALSRLDRELQLRELAIAYKTAAADGRLDPLERALIHEFCEELVIGEAELKYFFKS